MYQIKNINFSYLKGVHVGMSLCMLVCMPLTPLQFVCNKKDLLRNYDIQK